MILATQNCNRVYFTENNDVLEVRGNSVVLVRLRNAYIMGEYESADRARSVLWEVANNMDAGGLVFPDV